MIAFDFVMLLSLCPLLGSPGDADHLEIAHVSVSCQSTAQADNLICLYAVAAVAP
jgi:hypothetical protein